MRPQSGRIFFCVTGGLRPRFSKKIDFCGFGSDIGFICRLGMARTGVGHGLSVFQSFVAYLGQRPATAILAGFSGILTRFILWFRRSNTLLDQVPQVGWWWFSLDWGCLRPIDISLDRYYWLRYPMISIECWRLG